MSILPCPVPSRSGRQGGAVSLAEDAPNLGRGLDLLAIDDLQYVTSDHWGPRAWTDED